MILGMSVSAFTTLLALYLNVFVGIVQAFQKIPALHQLAPQGSEPLFAAVQLVVLLIFVFLVWRCLRKFHPAAVEATAQKT